MVNEVVDVVAVEAVVVDVEVIAVDGVKVVEAVVVEVEVVAVVGVEVVEDVVVDMVVVVGIVAPDGSMYKNHCTD